MTIKDAERNTYAPAHASRGARLGEAMRRRGVTKLSVLAKSLNVTESAVCRWRSKGVMTLANVIAVCTVLDVSVDWLLLGRGHMDLHRTAEVVGTPLEAWIHRLPPDARELLTTLAQAFLQHL